MEKQQLPSEHHCLLGGKRAILSRKESYPLAEGRMRGGEMLEE